METQFRLDPKLVERALKISGENNQKAVITRALKEFISRREPKNIKDLLGQLDWDENYDYKAERSRQA